MPDEHSRNGVPVAFRGGGFSPKPRAGIGLLVFVALIAFWEWGSQSSWISALVLPAPSEAFTAFKELAISGNLWKHVSASLYRLVIGWTSGAILGLIVGAAIGLFSLARAGSLMATDQLIAGVAMLSILGLSVAWLISRAERYFLNWRT